MSRDRPLSLRSPGLLPLTPKNVLKQVRAQPTHIQSWLLTALWFESICSTTLTSDLKLFQLKSKPPYCLATTIPLILAGYRISATIYLCFMCSKLRKLRSAFDSSGCAVFLAIFSSCFSIGSGFTLGTRALAGSDVCWLWSSYIVIIFPRYCWTGRAVFFNF
jgi:hypothetical protein